MYGRFARLITDYCTQVKKGDEVLITSTIEAYPLVRELWRAVVERGAYPRLSLDDEVLNEIFYRYAPKELLERISEIDKFIMENVDVRIRILSSTHTKPFVGVDPERVRIRSKALGVLSEIFRRREASGELRWVVTAYPTRALAQEAGMSPLEFEDFLFKALKLHYEDPAEEWRKQGEKQERIINTLSEVSELRFVDDDTDLTVRVEGRRWINDDGRKNMPGGEVFTGPHEDGVDGYVTFTYPAVWRGIEVEGVRLEFRKGVVVKASAIKGEEYLLKVLEIDEGAKRLGELAFGLNYDIRRFTKQILFDEKIGGTIHMALGSAYLDTGGKNKSAIHWDMVKDMRKGKVFADGELIYEKGRFIEEVL